MSVTWEIREGDALSRLREMPDESVQCCVTSPPYFGLRDYGTGEWEGGEEACSHVQEIKPGSYSQGFNERWGNASGARKQEVSGLRPYREVCGRCGARRIDRQLGLEATPDEFVTALVGVFREVRRVLRADGTLWLNLGDSYANDAKWGGSSGGKHVTALHGSTGIGRGRRHTGLKGKDLLGIPWAVAFALRADGWYLRSDIIWSKPNPMPESVTDRPTSAHEHLFLLAKSPRYFYDADAIREPNDHPNRTGTNPRLSISTKPGNTFQIRGDERTGIDSNPAGRNRRNVWEITTQPYPEAHFATFPPKLVEPCVLAGSAPDDMVLDPFAGAGTTGVVALRHDRSFIGIELNPAYCTLARYRIRDDAPLLNTGCEAGVCEHPTEAVTIGGNGASDD